MKKLLALCILFLLINIYAQAQTKEAQDKHRKENKMSRKERKEWNKVPSDKDREKTFGQGEQKKQRGYRKHRTRRARHAHKPRRSKASSDRQRPGQ